MNNIRNVEERILNVNKLLRKNGVFEKQILAIDNYAKELDHIRKLSKQLEDAITDLVQDAERADSYNALSENTDYYTFYFSMKDKKEVIRLFKSKRHTDLEDYNSTSTNYIIDVELSDYEKDEMLKLLKSNRIKYEYDESEDYWTHEHMNSSIYWILKNIGQISGCLTIVVEDVELPDLY